MAEKKPQTLANHARFDPLFHFVVGPVFILAAIGGTIHFLWHPSFHSASFFVISVAALIAVLKIRLYALKVQDRVIRLEERLRLTALCSEPLRSRIPELTVEQLSLCVSPPMRKRPDWPSEHCRKSCRGRT